MQREMIKGCMRWGQSSDHYADECGHGERKHMEQESESECILSDGISENRTTLVS